jgi:guanosine-3',5'-bis(diphosphate) 3'-pyrophosphohydrolase
VRSYTRGALDTEDYNKQTEKMQALLDKIHEYLPQDRAQLVEDALSYAREMHEGQTRRSGEPYIEHPVSAASYLADLLLDATTIAAALLHDVVEDCGVTIDELRERFGDEVARLVDGVTKLTKLDLLGLDENGVLQTPVGNEQAESLRKMLVAMAEDIRVVLIKLADRLHNMQTLGALSPHRQIAIAQETLDIYAPLAHRLGMGEVKWQLEDLSFRYLQPADYKSISKLLSTKRQEREAYVEQVTEVLKRELARANFNAEVTGRPKHIYSVYQKAQAYAAQGKQLSDIYDLFAVRVLVPSVQDCYGALGVVHSLWRPLPGQFDDYIANPKENDYQSLHTTVRSIGGLPLEVQVRTYQMHRISEYGVASHWSYKEGGSGGKDVQFEERMTWLRQLLEWQRDVSGTEEFLENVRTDIFRDQVFVYTPKNSIKELPAGSTPIDFAYRIHTDLGHSCIGAKVNGKLVGLDTQLKNGDTVEVLTSRIARGPSLDWLNPHLEYVKTSSARQAIRAWFRREERGENVQRGRNLLKRELKRLNDSTDEAEIATLFNYESEDDLFAAIGSGMVSMAQVAGRLTANAKPEISNIDDASLTGPTAGITVLGVGDLLTRMGECCHPLPGDDITGYVTRSRGVTVHRMDCPNLTSLQQPDSSGDRMVPVSWGKRSNLYPVRLKIEAFDRMGLLHDITGATSIERVNIRGSQTDVHSDHTVTVHVTVEVQGMEQLSRLFSRIEGVRGVHSVNRTIQAPAPRAS